MERGRHARKKSERSGRDARTPFLMNGLNSGDQKNDRIPCSSASTNPPPTPSVTLLA
jgi:hypothetical protein